MTRYAIGQDELTHFLELYTMQLIDQSHGENMASSPKRIIRIVLADDHAVTREGIRQMLDAAADLRVVGEAQDGLEAMQLAAQLQPDIPLLELQMPGPRPAEVERWVRANCPHTETLVLTAHDRRSYLAEMIDAGAVGYLHIGLATTIAFKDKACEAFATARHHQTHRADARHQATDY